MNPVATVLLEFVGRVLRWLLLMPVVLAVGTPFILVLALFRPRPYWSRVGELYTDLRDFWVRWGWDLTP